MSEYDMAEIQTKFKRATLQHAVFVAKKIKSCVRTQDLTWNHHRVVALHFDDEKDIKEWLKRSEAAKEQPRTEDGLFERVRQQSVATPVNKHPQAKAKAKASKTNPGAVAAWVSRKIETSRRREVLSWSHHREVAALELWRARAVLSHTAEHAGRPPKEGGTFVPPSWAGTFT